MPAKALNPEQTLHWTKWYSLQRWRRRAKFQLQCEPLCRMCEAAGKVVVARVADHIVDHAGIWNEFRTGKLQSLCLDCHARKHDRPLPRGYGNEVDASGYPVDGRHPFYRGR